jgi:hypothetical protein
MKRASLIGVLGVLSYLILVPASSSLAAASGAHASGTVTYTGTAGHATRLTQAATVSALPAVVSAFHNGGPQAFTPFRSPAGSSPAKSNAAAPAMSANAAASGTASAASSTASGGGSSGASIVQRFNGLSDLDSDNLNGFAVTPPDQGLCVGRDGTLAGRPKAVWEPINLAARETSVNGTVLQPDVSLATLFQDPFAEGDVRCLYDPSTQSFYFTEIGFPPGGPSATLTNTVDDVVVMNSRGIAAYQFDSSLGGTCLGDQPKTGFDNNALIISTDEYCGPTLSNYEGAIVTAISKSQLVHEDATVNDSVLGPVSLSGIPVTGLDPAINTGTRTGYLVNSFPFDAAGNNNAVADTVGTWSLKNDASVTTGHGTPVLTGTAIPSQSYAFPVPAASTGDGSVTSQITSEAFLNPDDSRMSGPVVVTQDHGRIQLWTALDAAVTFKGGTATGDAAAWFAVDPIGKRVAAQGYVVAKGANLLYPAIQPQRFGPAALVFTITSSSINPSAAFTTLGSRKITVVAPGAGPHLSFSDVLFSEARWGDYSFVAVDPGGRGIWLATEYIPPPAFQDPSDNWGTYVFEVAGH